MRGFPCRGKVIHAWNGKRVPKLPAPKPKPRYRLTNWREYNRALVARARSRCGSTMRWSAAGERLAARAGATATWRSLRGLGPRSDVRADAAPDPRVPAGSDAAARAGGRRAALFHPLAATLAVPAVRRPCDGPVHLAVDATGLKVNGRVEDPRPSAGQAPGLAPAAPGGRHPDRRPARPSVTS